MRIGLDALGGDYAPAEAVAGALATLDGERLEVALIGPPALLEEELTRQQVTPSQRRRLALIPAGQVVTMEEHAASAVHTKRDATVVVGMELLQRGEVAALISAGNSGATMVAALLMLGSLPGVARPAIASFFPTVTGQGLLLDVGANSQCRPLHLVQFARMGSLFVERVLGVSRPRVGLLNIGEEASKGTPTVQEAYRLLQGSGLNFVGNVEGHGLPLGKADVVVSDGFTGNIVLKVSEGVGELLWQRLGRRLLELPAEAQKLRAEFDYAEYGGAPLLGVRGNVIIAHGRSRAKAFSSAFRLAKGMVEKGALQALTQGMSAT